MGWRSRRELRIQTVQNLNMMLVQRQQLAVAEEQARLAQQAAFPGSIPAGWYADPRDARFVMWWDGGAWALHTRRRA